MAARPCTKWYSSIVAGPVAVAGKDGELRGAGVIAMTMARGRAGQTAFTSFSSVRTWQHKSPRNRRPRFGFDVFRHGVRDGANTDDVPRPGGL